MLLGALLQRLLLVAAAEGERRSASPPSWAVAQALQPGHRGTVSASLLRPPAEADCSRWRQIHRYRAAAAAAVD
jgi:hypothetical protein